jgi:hypothetical protein
MESPGETAMAAFDPRHAVLLADTFGTDAAPARAASIKQKTATQAVG